MLEEVIQVSGGEGLGGYLEAAADLHRAVTLLWEGVGNVLKTIALSETDKASAYPRDPTQQVRRLSNGKKCVRGEGVAKNQSTFHGEDESV